jgi:hypothetical protein
MKSYHLQVNGWNWRIWPIDPSIVREMGVSNEFYHEFCSVRNVQIN